MKTAGYQLALVTNRSKPVREELAELGLLDFFDLALTAGEADAWKPDPAIFTQALRRLDAPAETAAYVGDNYYADVIGARRAGLQPILFDPMDLFPEAECCIIRALKELQGLIRLPG
jgi:putative hydrolase of the HAD superfamily